MLREKSILKVRALAPIPFAKRLSFIRVPKMTLSVS